MLLFRTVLTDGSAQIDSPPEGGLRVIEERHQSAEFPPTLQETAVHFGLNSANSVRQHLRLIENNGLVKWVPGRWRATAVRNAGGRARSGFARVPFVGTIAAGNPMANENVESNLDRPPNLFRRAELFSLRVKSGSVEEAGILDGDVGSVDAAAKVKPGEIGAVLISEEATLKYVHHGAGILLLKPANRAYSDITIARFEQLRVMGSVVGVVRSI